MCLSHPENKPPRWAETGLKRSTNPPQRVLLYKDLQNILTPLEVPSRPLKVPARLFTPDHAGKSPPAWVGVLIKSLRKWQKSTIRPSNLSETDRKAGTHFSSILTESQKSLATLVSFRGFSNSGFPAQKGVGHPQPETPTNSETGVDHHAQDHRD